MIFNGGEKNKNILKIHLFTIFELAARELILERRFVPQLSSLGVKGRGLGVVGIRRQISGIGVRELKTFFQI